MNIRSGNAWRIARLRAWATRVENRLRRRTDVAGAGRDQFLLAAVPVQYADRVYSVVLRPDHVVAAVADHQGLRRLHA